MTYLLRDIPPDWWPKIKATAALEKLSVKEVLLRFLADYAKGKKR